MNATTSSAHNSPKFSTTKRRKKSGWTPLGVAALVLGFMTAWPIGLAVLAYILWGGRIDDLFSEAVNFIRGATRSPMASSGNAAFDEYKAATLRDLEEQQAEFNDYVEKLRRARDREEFEHFMQSRNKHEQS